MAIGYLKSGKIILMDSEIQISKGGPDVAVSSNVYWKDFKSKHTCPPLHMFPAAKVLKHWVKHKHRLALISNRASSESVVVKRLRTQQEEAYTSKLFI